MTRHDATDRATTDSDRHFRRALAALALLGCALGIYVFFLPYNTIADEEEYLTEIFSAAAGRPDGWNIRHLLYPIMLSPFVTAASFIGVEVPSLALVARLANWMMWWVGLYASFQIARRLFDAETAWLAVALIAFNGVWMLSGKRLMMDVPGSVWLLLAIYFHAVREELGLKWLLAGIFCATMATVTKFQMGPPAVIYVLFVILERFLVGKRVHAAIGLAFGLMMLLVVGLVDRITYGTWFSSILEFRQYNFVNMEASPEEMYGACEDLFYYVFNAKAVFSHFVWPLALMGLAGLLLFKHSAERILLLLTTGAYLAVMHGVCHKQYRYLIGILPQLSILAASSYIFLLRRLAPLCRESLRPALLGTAFAGVAVIVFSLIPRTEVRELLSQRETCADFVYRSSSLIPKGAKVVLAVPCGMPTYYLKDFRVSFGNIPYNEDTKNTVLKKYRAAVDEAQAVFVDPDNVLGQDVLSRWAPDSYITHSSPLGQYKLFLRKNLPPRAPPAN